MDAFGNTTATPESPTAAPTTGGPSGPRAGFWQRFGAAFLDWVLLTIVAIVLQLALKGVGSLLALLVQIGYFVYFEGGPTGQTIGKRALGIRVIDFDTGGPMGYGRALLRWFGRIVSAIPLFLGDFWMLWDKEKQAWQDKFANDVVVPVSAYPVRPG